MEIIVVISRLNSRDANASLNDEDLAKFAYERSPEFSQIRWRQRLPSRFPPRTHGYQTKAEGGSHRCTISPTKIHRLREEAPPRSISAKPPSRTVARHREPRFCPSSPVLRSRAEQRDHWKSGGQAIFGGL